MMGDIFKHFLNDCTNVYGKIIEANLYKTGFATIKVEMRNNKVLELTIKIEEAKEEVTENAETV